MEKTSLLIAAAALAFVTGGAAGFAAELPTYAAAGLPISTVQVQVLGAAEVREQAPVATSAASPHQMMVLTPRTKMTTATATQSQNGTARAIR